MNNALQAPLSPPSASNSNSRSPLDRFSISLQKLNCEAAPWIQDIDISSAAVSASQQQRRSRHASSSNCHASQRRPRYQDLKTKRDNSEHRGGRYYNAAHWSSCTLADSANSSSTAGGATNASATNASSSSASASSTATRPTSTVTRSRNSESMESFRSTSTLHHTQTPAYLGWRRSSETLAFSDPRSYMTPSERLTMSLHKDHNPSKQFSKSTTRLDRRPTTSNGNVDNHEFYYNSRFNGGGGREIVSSSHRIHDSIRNVTSAIIDYCGQDNVPDNTTRQFLPNRKLQKLVWMESSFVTSKT